MTPLAIMLGLGLTCAVWCIGLVLWVVHLDTHERAKMIRLMTTALDSILERTGELHRQNKREPFEQL